MKRCTHEKAVRAGGPDGAQRAKPDGAQRANIVAWSQRALCAALLAGCGAHADVTAPSSNATAGQTNRSFLERIPDAPMTVAYAGSRHVAIHYAQGGVPSLLEYDEDVSSDGRGNFVVVPGQVTSPPMTTEQREFFAILQERRDGFFYRYRDFRIRDWRTFLQNWRVVDTGHQESVAGRSSALLEIRRVHGASDWYRAWVDLETGLVMRADEFDATDQLVSRTEFRTFTLAPDLSGVALHGDRNPGKPFDPTSDTTQSLGFRVLVPTILPEGYRLERSESLSVGGSGAELSTWARLAFGDGVEQLFFLQTVAGQNAATAGQSALPWCRASSTACARSWWGRPNWRAFCGCSSRPSTEAGFRRGRLPGVCEVFSGPLGRPNAGIGGNLRLPGARAARPLPSRSPWPPRPRFPRRPPLRTRSRSPNPTSPPPSTARG